MERSTSTAEESTQAEPKFDLSDLGALQEAWWTWAASAPRERNPVFDVTGKYCAMNQPDGVWFVAPSLGLPAERRCSVPAGVPLAGPAVNLLSGETGACDDFMPDATGEVTLDGDAVPLKAKNFDAVTFSAVEGNPFTTAGGSSGLAVGYGCGLWFSVPGLDPGEHVLEIRGSSKDVLGSVNYKLTATVS